MEYQALRDFYYGNLIPSNRQALQSAEAVNASKELEDVERQLRAMLSPEAADLLDRLSRAHAMLNGFTEADSYIDGFRTGARIMLEILGETKEDIHGSTNDQCGTV